MTNFNYKKYLTENKLTQTTKLRAGILAEGQFSWMTQDTGQQIGSQDENQIPVYMFDDKGKYYYESDYDGYGVFGGMDYYELLDKMNGGEGDRSRGIDLAFDKIKTTSPVLYPALITRPNFNWKSHDFTQEPENDPNQSWYMEPEEDEDDDNYDDSRDVYDDEYPDMAEGKEPTEPKVIAYNKIKADWLKLNPESKWEDLSDEEQKAIFDKNKNKNFKDIKGWDYEEEGMPKATKFKKSDLKAKIKEMIVAEMNINEDTFAPESEEDFLAEVDRILAEADEVAVDDTEVAVDGEENIDVDTTIQVDPNVKAVQDALTQAQAAAQKLGDSKLTDQIGNTITFFTRTHVVDQGAVAEAKEMEEDKKSSINEAEGRLVDEKTGEEVILPYETLDFRGDPITVISFRAPHKPSSSGRISTEDGGEYFPSVAGLKIIDHSFSEDLNESMFPMLKRILK